MENSHRWLFESNLRAVHSIYEENEPVLSDRYQDTEWGSLPNLGGTANTSS
jgi:hypothetical protein